MSTIDDLTAQRTALETRRSAFLQAVSDAEALIRDGVTVEATIEARMRMGAARSEIAAVEQQLAALDQQIADAQALAERQAAIERLAGYAADGMQALAKWEAARKKANEQIGQLIEPISVALQAIQAARASFLDEANQLVPGVRGLRGRRMPIKASASASVSGDTRARYARSEALIEDESWSQAAVDALLAELEATGADLTAVRALWIEHELATAIDQDYPAPDLKPFGTILPLLTRAYHSVVIPPAGAGWSRQVNREEFVGKRSS